MSLQKDLVKALLQIKAIRLNPQKPFTWASGWKSPIYCDNRMSLSHPAVRDIVKLGLSELSKSFDFDVIAGVATAGIPHGALVADHLSKPFAYVRSSSKDHGRQNKIEGDLATHQKILLVEDLISTGGSLSKAALALRENGFNVVGALAIFTYGFPQSTEHLSKHDIPFKTLANYDALLEEAIQLSYLRQEDLALLKQWREDPANWNPN